MSAKAIGAELHKAVFNIIKNGFGLVDDAVGIVGGGEGSRSERSGDKVDAALEGTVFALDGQPNRSNRAKVRPITLFVSRK